MICLRTIWTTICVAWVTQSLLSAQVLYSSQILPVPAGFNQGLAASINESGVVAGAVWCNPGNGCVGQPAVWENGLPRILPMPQNYVLQVVLEINSSGQVLAHITDNVQDRSVLWTNGIPTLLPEGMHANSLNDAGYVIGATIPEQRPFLWHPTQGLVSLNLPPAGPGIGQRIEELNRQGHFLYSADTVYLASQSGIIRPILLPSLPTGDLCAGSFYNWKLRLSDNDEVLGVCLGRAIYWDSNGIATEIPRNPGGAWGLSNYSNFNGIPGQVLFAGGTWPDGTCIWIWRPSSGVTPSGCAPLYSNPGGRHAWNSRGQMLGYVGLGAVYRPYPILTTKVYPAGSGSVTPATGQQAPGSAVSLSATPEPGFVFTGFSGALSGSTSPQLLTIPEQDLTVWANFAPAQPSLVAQVAGSANSSGIETVRLRLRNTGLGPALDAAVTRITNIQVLSGSGAVSLRSGIPFTVSGAIPAGATSATSDVQLNWPSTVNLVRFTVFFTANSGAYSGSTTVVAAR